MALTMNMAERILELRKKKGISQEELADKIGVSRQAVSKWESDTSYPEPEKIILLSDFFQVSTDYLLKGDAAAKDSNDSHNLPLKQPKSPTESLIFAAVGTALNAMGLLVGLLIWTEERTPVSVAAGLILMVFGCMLFAIGQFEENGRPSAHRRKTAAYFWMINIWLLSLMPISCIFNFIQGTLGGHWWAISPIPQLGNTLGAYLLCWSIYLLLCITTDIFLLIKIRKSFMIPA